LVTLTVRRRRQVRLAEEVAERFERRTGEPAVLVELAAVDDDSLVPGRSRPM
jgi:hypothetical protein